MDKIWWNEQWMGYPIGPEYAAASNVDNAYRLQGKLFLIVGEMDSNVDPSSTMQVVDALIKADISGNLYESKLIGSVLVGSVLNGADLRSANLRGARLRASELRDGDFSDFKL